MDFSGEYRIQAPRDRVWAALNDPESLKQAIPGCQSLEKKSDTELTATVQAKVGPVKATFGGDVTLEDLNPPESYTLRGSGKGGAAGFAKGHAKVHLAEDGPDTTVLTYNAQADVGGKIAQLGSRLMQGTAKKYADEFFGNLSSQLGTTAVPAGAAEPLPTTEEKAAPAPLGFSPTPLEPAGPRIPLPAGASPAAQEAPIPLPTGATPVGEAAGAAAHAVGGDAPVGQPDPTAPGGRGEPAAPSDRPIGQPDPEAPATAPAAAPAGATATPPPAMEQVSPGTTPPPASAETSPTPRASQPSGAPSSSESGGGMTRILVWGGVALVIIVILVMLLGGGSGGAPS
ncbi:SRPBCC domain-containing protein [Marinivivus vitaminiproducens]|uniref:CoxG family protein n=1 Tax=Marinivivus vitaminiproducens TaxID=3035935 RepID=UPI003FA16AA1